MPSPSPQILHPWRTLGGRPLQLLFLLCPPPCFSLVGCFWLLSPTSSRFTARWSDRLGGPWWEPMAHAPPRGGLDCRPASVQCSVSSPVTRVSRESSPRGTRPVGCQAPRHALHASHLAFLPQPQGRQCYESHFIRRKLRRRREKGRPEPRRKRRLECPERPGCLAPRGHSASGVWGVLEAACFPCTASKNGPPLCDGGTF